MNTRKDDNTTRPNAVDTAHLDADLVELSDLLDRLGRADAEAASPSMSERAALVSLGALHGIVETSAQVSELGAMDRASAPRDLERQVFEVSRSELAAIPASGLRLQGAGGQGRGSTIVVRRPWARLAIAAGLAFAAGVSVWSMLRTSSPGTVQVADGTAKVAEQLRQEMDTLFQALEDSPVATTRERDAEFDPAWLDDWLKEGAS